uniref:Eukaryotic translation initiation factor 3 subunit J n=1 Tax=Maconellicoccus hirsutus TaxID=177089 RepID=A2I3V2_MACHI|nr:eukaryotic translation initiation factor 3 subunit 1-like protein [Maconellicoccus hirsutus]
MDWDSENFEPKPIASSVNNKWDGEDEDDNIKDNWEDDEDTRKDDSQRRQSAQSKKPKSRLEEAIEERERKERERKSKLRSELEKDIDTTNMTPEEIQAEKLRRQKLLEEVDLEDARDTLGLEGDSGFLDGFNPTTEEEFGIFKDALCKKILSFKKSDHFVDFLDEFFKDMCADMNSNKLKKLKMNMDSLYNEKVKVEKSEKTKKTKGKGKAKIRVEQNDMVYDEYSAYTIDEYDDFM